MTVKITREFLEKIPKTDLHVHLDGSLRLSTLIELSKAAKVPLPSDTEAGLQELVFKEKYQDLPDYLRGFDLTCAVLQTAESLERVAYELALDNIAENVRYIEVRYAPQLHVRPGFTVEAVVESVHRGLERAQREHNSSPGVRQGTDPVMPGGFGQFHLRGDQPHTIFEHGDFDRLRGQIDDGLFLGETYARDERQNSGDLNNGFHGSPPVGLDCWDIYPHHRTIRRWRSVIPGLIE